MDVLLFGGSGMVGQGALRECLLDSRVARVVSIVRQPTGQTDAKLRELVIADLWRTDSLGDQLAGFDACLFCVGVTSAGMSEPEYTKVTQELTMKIASQLAALNLGMTFIYVTGQGTDSTERGRVMWARVKGRTENALLALPFKAAYMFRPGVIQPLRGIRSKTALYRTIYTLTEPLLPVLKRLLPNMVTTTEEVGRAMLNVAAKGYPKSVLETADIAGAS
jgi:uncharacterized protein YbjT (DUF2867 family)